MKIRSEFRDLRRLLARSRVSTKVRLAALGRIQQHICKRLDAMDARFAGMENDLALIRECLVMKGPEAERDPLPDAKAQPGG